MSAAKTIWSMNHERAVRSPPDGGCPFDAQGLPGGRPHRLRPAALQPGRYAATAAEESRGESEASGYTVPSTLTPATRPKSPRFRVTTYPAGRSCSFRCRIPLAHGLAALQELLIIVLGSRTVVSIRDRREQPTERSGLNRRTASLYAFNVHERGEIHAPSSRQ